VDKDKDRGGGDQKKRTEQDRAARSLVESTPWGGDPRVGRVAPLVISGAVQRGAKLDQFRITTVNGSECD